MTKTEGEGSGPFMRLFVNDWLDPSSRINTLTPAQECAYLRLCLFQFRDPEGFLPDAPALLAHYSRIAPADADAVLKPVLEAFFEHDKARKRWSCPRVHEEWLRSHKRTDQAQLAAEKRWASKRARDASALRPHMQMEMEKEIKKETENNDLVPLRGTGRLGRGLKALIPTTRPAETGPEFEVFAYWRERCGKVKATWTHDRKRVLSRRLAEDPDGVAGLKLAVDGALADPLHNGTDKGTRYWEFENLFVHGGRNRVEKLQGAATRSRGATLSDGSRKTLTAAEAWLARKGAARD